MPGEQFVNSIEMKLTRIKEGTFRMGSPDSDPEPFAKPDEKPQHRVPGCHGHGPVTFSSPAPGGPGLEAAFP